MKCKINLNDDHVRLIDFIKDPYENDALESWFMKKLPTYYIMIDDEFKRCEDMKKWIAAAGVEKK